MASSRPDVRFNPAITVTAARATLPQAPHHRPTNSLLRLAQRAPPASALRIFTGPGYSALVTRILCPGCCVCSSSCFTLLPHACLRSSPAAARPKCRTATRPVAGGRPVPSTSDAVLAARLQPPLNSNSSQSRRLSLEHRNDKPGALFSLKTLF